MDASARYCTDGLIRHVIVEKTIFLKAGSQYPNKHQQV